MSRPDFLQQVGSKDNGVVNGCRAEHEVQEMKGKLTEIYDLVTAHDSTLTRLADILENKLDKLIDVVAGRGMIPVDVFRWLVLFVVLFVFTMEFGTKGVSELVNLIHK